MWATVHGSEGRANDVSYAIAVDDRGNAFAAGRLADVFGTVAYDPSGNICWEVSRGDGPATDVAVGPGRRVCVTGDWGETSSTVQYRT